MKIRESKIVWNLILARARNLFEGAFVLEKDKTVCSATRIINNFLLLLFRLS